MQPRLDLGINWFKVRAKRHVFKPGKPTLQSIQMPTSTVFVEGNALASLNNGSLMQVSTSPV